MKFMRKMEPQLSPLSISGRSLHNTLSSERWRKKHRPHEHLTEVREDGRLKDGVGRKVMILEAELLQQQQKERPDRQHQPARILPANADAPHPSRLRTWLSATPDWKHSGWTSKATTITAAESRGAQIQGGAENSKAKGRSSWKECESVTTARRVNPFSRKTLPLAPQDAAGNLARCALK
jgi:hypothetical protein